MQQASSAGKRATCAEREYNQRQARENMQLTPSAGKHEKASTALKHATCAKRENMQQAPSAGKHATGASAWAIELSHE